MADKWKNKWGVPSSSADGIYVVARDWNDNFACSCLGWTRHMPRTDCKHIRQVRALELGQPSTAKTMEELVVLRLEGRLIEKLR